MVEFEKDPDVIKFYSPRLKYLQIIRGEKGLKFLDLDLSSYKTTDNIAEK